jgi:DNA replication and repair protein RecF
MYISSLEIKNFRNIKNTKLEFHPKINVIFGRNGQGKTNLLEAIYFLGIARSFRTSYDQTLISKDNKNLSLSGVIIRKDSQLIINIYLGETKKVKINNKLLHRIVDLIGNMGVVIFSPEDLALVKGEPEVRRRFLDVLISQANPQYLYYLQKYNKILKHRNEMLNQMKTANSEILNDRLDIWDIQLKETGDWLNKKRQEVISMISGFSRKIYNQITQEKLKILYKPSIFSMNKRTEEINRGYTLSGPHRDDMIIEINDTEAKYFCSQGEQRSAAISLRLSEIEYLYNKIRETPILLLDDVCSELDNIRREYLMKEITKKEYQVFITTTDRNIVEILPNEKAVFKVETGIIIQEY